MKFLASHESSTRGTFDFPIELYYVDKMHPRYEMPFHWHMEFELMLVLSGEFSLLIDLSSRKRKPTTLTRTGRVANTKLIVELFFVQLFERTIC